MAGAAGDARRGRQWQRLSDAVRRDRGRRGARLDLRVEDQERALAAAARAGLRTIGRSRQPARQPAGGLARVRSRPRPTRAICLLCATRRPEASQTSASSSNQPPLTCLPRADTWSGPGAGTARMCQVSSTVGAQPVAPRPKTTGGRRIYGQREQQRIRGAVLAEPEVTAHLRQPGRLVTPPARAGRVEQDLDLRREASRAVGCHGARPLAQVDAIVDGRDLGRRPGPVQRRSSPPRPSLAAPGQHHRPGRRRGRSARSRSSRWYQGSACRPVPGWPARSTRSGRA